MIKFRGRIITISIVVVVETIFLVFGYNVRGYIESIDKIMVPSLFVLAWYLGGVYDKSEYHAEKDKIKKIQLEKIRDSLNGAIWSYDIDKKSVTVSTGIEKIFGIPVENYHENPMIWKEIVHLNDLKLVEIHRSELLSGKDHKLEFRIVRENDRIIWVKVHSSSILDVEKRVIMINSLIVDITEQKYIEGKYRNSKESYEQLLKLSPIGIIISQKDKIKYVNKAALCIFGDEDDKKIIDNSLFEKIHPNYHNLFKYRVKELDTIEEHKNLMFYELYNSYGGLVPVEIISRKVTFMDESALLVMVIDVTEKKESEKKIMRLAYFDVLTGLPNRNMLRIRFNETVKKMKLEEKEMGVIFLDLDRFKIINDTMGHDIGDIVLQLVAKKLNKIIGENDMICRYGGDEFIIVLSGTNKTEVTKMLKKIIEEFRYPIIINDKKFYTSASLGVSMYPKDGDNLETLVKHADTAMFCSKDNGKNKFEFYDDNLGDAVLKKMHLENELREAILNDELLLYYQPQMDLVSEKMVGVEALIRWNHPEKGLIYPGEFIPIAEETGLIIPIGEWIIKTACKQNKIWQDSGFNPLNVAINISNIQFMDKNFLDFVKNVLKDIKLEHKYVEFEMTESIMQDYESITEVINELKNIGIKLSLDDFGTGYSSLSVLKHLPIDTLKIDKSFVDEITTEHKGKSMVKTIIDMGENLGINVIAEGIENKEQIEYLKQNNCKMGQGYYYNRPLPVEDITRVLEANI